MVSYAKFDKLARELDGESTNPTDGTWTKRRQDEFYLDPAVARPRRRKTPRRVPLLQEVRGGARTSLVKQLLRTTAGRGWWCRGGSARACAWPPSWSRGQA